MNVINLKFEDLKRSMITGGYAYEFTADPNTRHMVWMNKMFVPGIAMGDNKIDIPIDTNVPNLFFLLDMKEKMETDVTIYRVRSIAFTGIGIVFHNYIPIEE